ncbi:PAAR-like domain-containing protein [Vibrio sagamiensis]|uniref:Toxin VasX N-terminal region domain-containing protein n=1 Tax=Vibrio sagamiensis NBRC 104589 TaxID=1219064 RepID=A0A511QFB2_9VIBR|nr:PAAR-like domain-containing protein [Vibrio sagamiensis]GEM75152.1 hypothetical protein VSA01S_12640 [Vibrio sagamiensis NBRC 104589]
MAVTIAANGLSIVHKDSGGEANASVPDVCLTKVGKPVVPIPYGNNAKSSDLAGGTTTVTADGGNSIALKDSTFSKSTGDAGGDKKGVSSGTIEAEAKFISASSTVLFEGKGVARQTDQMTMNKANTMCFGVENPSVSVEEDVEETHDLEVCIRYPNGKRLTNAPFELINEAGAVVGSGTLDGQGKAIVTGLKPDKVKLVAQESQDDLVLKPLRRDNPHYQESVSDEDFFELATKGQRGFWQPTRVESFGTAWGCMGPNLNEDKFFHDVMETEIKMHFSHFDASSKYDFDKVCASSLCHLRQPLPHTTESLLAKTMPHALEEGDILSTILCLDPRETSDSMLGYIRGLGEGNPQSFLEKYNWEAAKKTMQKELESLDKKVRGRLTYLHDEASKEYESLEEVLSEHLNKLDAYSKAKTEQISNAFAKLEAKAKKILENIENVKVTQEESPVSTESKTVTSTVNAPNTIKTVEPYLEEIPGVIKNAIPIYPVRYGYANVFDEIIEAQNPLTLPEMKEKQNIQETGGYLFRLLREGWIYIKEEREGKVKPFHIFKYSQIALPNGVLEKFEKYIFTNKINASGGLTLDTSSGKTFYPCPFVSTKAKKVSIAYSAHEWTVELIDSINDDKNKELREKTMQQIDVTESETDYSIEATPENLTKLVEDYRMNDKKWLGLEDSQAEEYGFDYLTADLSYHLSPEGIIENMYKGNSENKGGILVALFDPIGRQADLAFALTQLTVWEEQDKVQKRYPRGIAQILNQAFLSEKAPEEIKEAALENLHIEELKKFNKETDNIKAYFKERRIAILNVYRAFAYRQGDDQGFVNSIGSLDTYFKTFFDIKSDKPKDPVKEVEEVASVVTAIFEGVGSSVEGQDLLADMMNQAYETDDDLIKDSENSYGLPLDYVQRILTQCQNGVATDWGEATKRLLEIFKNLYNHAAAVNIYGPGVSETFHTKLTGSSIEKIVKSLLPIFSKRIFGFSLTGKTVSVQMSELSLILGEFINPGGKSPRYNWEDPNLDWAKKLLAHKNKIDKANGNGPSLEVPEVEHHGADGKSTSSAGGNAASFLVSAVGAGWSWYINATTLLGFLSDERFKSSDPLADPHGGYYDYLQIVSALTAITIDSAAVSGMALKVYERSLNSARLGATGIQKILPAASKSAQLKIATFLSSKVANGLIATANLAVAFTESRQAYLDWESGNVGGAIGHGTLVLSSLSFAAAGVGGIISTSSAIIGALNIFGFVLLVIGGTLLWLFTKNKIENLLFNCFWGKSNVYGFWKHISNEGKLDLIKRFELSSSMVKSFPLQKAFEIEMQEFNNLLCMPSVEVESSSNFLSGKKTVSYQFKLPGYITDVSEICGSIQREYTDVQELHIEDMNKIKFDDEGTEEFKKALQRALNAAPRHENGGLVLNKGVLELNVEVTLNVYSKLYWYYQLQPGVITPKRMLESNGLAKKPIIGMIDKNLI